MSFENLLQLIAEKAPVQADVVNRPLRQLDQNTKYIWDVLQAAAIGSTVYARRVTVESEVKVGMAVYLNANTQTYTRALALAEVDDKNGVVATSASAQVWGIVATKHNATLADILLFGVDDIDISQATTDGAPKSGTYYLSAASPGKLVQQKPPVSVAVLRRTPDGKVFVQPQFVDYLDRHTHYRFKLHCKPAGSHTPPSLDGLHVITDGNSLLTGWLPADHPVFAGKAPPGAVFGYNLSAHSGLSSQWPPIPVANAELTWNKALSADVGFTGVPTGSGGLAVLDSNGIWWMSNCYGDVPWPVDYDSGNSASYSDSIGAECPRHIPMEMLLYFTKVNFATDSAVVLSLHSGDARLKVRCYGDASREASTGHLELDLDLNLVVKNDQPGYLALKDFDSTTSEFKRGPVTEGVYAVSSNVSLVSTATTTRSVSSVSRTVHHGLVGVSVDPSDTKELDVQLVRLDGAEEAYYGNPPLMYLEFRAGDEREYRGKINIPADLAKPDPEMKLRFWLLGRSVGTLPQLEFSYRIVPQPTAVLTSPVTLPDDSNEVVLTCTTAATLASTNQYVLAESAAFAVEAGSTVFFTVRRTASDGYAGAVGVIRQCGIIVAD